MKVIALVSGGKDSCFNMLLCKQYGHEIVALANLLPMAPDVDELDSYMFQTVGHQIISMYAACMGIPLFRRRIQGASVQQDLIYIHTERDEVEDMLQLLAFAKDMHPEIEAVSSGAIASDYQRQRVEHVCARLNLVSLSYMWHQPQSQLYHAMLDSDIKAILIKVAAMGLQPELHLGKSLQEMEHHLHRLERLYGCNICGEGGEYETLVLDCPLFQHACIELDAWEVQQLSAGGDGAVALLHPTQYHVCQKQPRDSAAAGKPESTRDMCKNASDTASQDTVIWVPSDYSAGLPRRSLPQREEEVLNIDTQVAVQSSTSGVHVSCTPHLCNADSGLNPGQRVQRALHAALDAIERELASHGLSLAAALFVHLYLARMEDFGAANAAYGHHFPAVSPPARACVQAQLPPGVDLMVDVLLTHDVALRRVLHVQSISCWAPSCIGPYSQVAVAHGLAFFAGQIGLDPPTMQLVQGGPRAEAARCLASCQAVAVAVRCDLPQAMLGCTVYAAPTGQNTADATYSGERSREEPPEAAEEAEEDDAFVDAYLQPPAMRRTWQPLVTYAVVSALPRGAAVEVQPVALSLFGQDPASVQGLMEGLRNSGHQAQIESGGNAMGHAESAVLCDTLSCAGRFCLCQLSIPPSGPILAGDAVSAGRAAAAGITRALQEAQMCLDDALVMRVYFCPAILAEEAVRDMSQAALQGCGGAQGKLAPVFVPVLAVGSTPAVQAVVHIVFAALRTHATTHQEHTE
ncbi:probable diphthine-ammonia ligase at N-terminal half [Coccomyxa sp. Obi]|nr:probable diphthine-ammonia ligase at N-terminal half [Coccomyxa sp. Obi]